MLYHLFSQQNRFFHFFMDIQQLKHPLTLFPTFTPIPLTFSVLLPWSSSSQWCYVPLFSGFLRRVWNTFGADPDDIPPVCSIYARLLLFNNICHGIDAHTVHYFWGRSLLYTYGIGKFGVLCYSSCSSLFLSYLCVRNPLRTPRRRGDTVCELVFFWMCLYGFVTNTFGNNASQSYNKKVAVGH